MNPNDKHAAHPISQTPPPSISSVPVIEKWTIKDAGDIGERDIYEGDKLVCAGVSTFKVYIICDAHNATVCSLTEWLQQAERELKLESKLYESCGMERAQIERERESLRTQLQEAEKKIKELEGKLNSPELHDFAQGAVLEAAHQRERWGSKHDAGKEPQDWFWVVGYLAGKALAAHISGNTEKALHHTISTAAVLNNWHAAITGASTLMRPGISQEKQAEVDSSPVPLQEAQSRPVESNEDLMFRYFNDGLFHQFVDRVAFEKLEGYKRVAERSAPEEVATIVNELRESLKQSPLSIKRKLERITKLCMEAQSRPVADTERLDLLEKFVRSKGPHGISFDFCKEENIPQFRIMWRHHLGDFRPTLRKAIDDIPLSASSKASEENKTDSGGKEA